MRSTIPLALSVLLLAAPAQADDRPLDAFLPLEQLPSARAPRAPLKERLFRWARKATRPVPHLRRLVLPTRGQLQVRTVLVEFPDVKHPPFTARHFHDALFSLDTYRRTATGAPAHGSLRDYFLENSSGALDMQGEVFDWIQIPTKRSELAGQILAAPGARQQLFNASLDLVLKREGSSAFQGVDALIFVIAGPQAGGRGEVTWPHSGVLFHRGRAFRYYLMHSGTKTFQPIGTHCHEMGHVLGILDKYGLGSGTGVGQWCLMANGGGGGRPNGRPLDAPPITSQAKTEEVVREQLEAARRWIERTLRIQPKAKPKPPAAKPPATPRPRPRPTGQTRQPKARPLHVCAVCKDRLGWSTPKVIDPRKGAAIYLTPVEQDANQVVRILLDARGRETLYLEYREKVGFDAELPESGLLVWRAGSPTALTRNFVPLEQVELIPAHGSKSVDAPHRAPTLVPFPAGGKRSLTIPCSLGDVVLSGITKKDGRLYVEIGLGL